MALGRERWVQQRRHRHHNHVARVINRVPRVDDRPLWRQVVGQGGGLDAEVQVHEGLAQWRAAAALLDAVPNVIRIHWRRGREQPIALLIEFGVSTAGDQAKGVVEVGVRDDGLGARTTLPPLSRTPTARPSSINTSCPACSSAAARVLGHAAEATPQRSPRCRPSGSPSQRPAGKSPRP